MFCSSCGNQLIEGARFCSGCGMQILVTEPVHVATPPPPPEPIMQKPITNNSLLTLDCFGGNMFSPNYVYLLLYNDRLESYSISSKKMEALIYNHIKELGKFQKVKLLERKIYRDQYIQTFKERLIGITDFDLGNQGILKEVIYNNSIVKAKFQFTSSKVVYSEDDSYVNKQRGYFSFKTTSGKYKYTHAYSYNKDMNTILKNTIGSVLKTYK